jgi:hypothetical protein
MAIRTGKMRNPQTSYKTSKHCVAYLDILGGKNKICADKDNTFLNTLNMVFQDAIEETNSLFRKETIFTKIFSDNILLAIEIEDIDNQVEEKLSSFLNLTANVVLEALRYGFLMRGAITIGDFFHNDILVYGKTLVDAVEMEEKIAIYPRIIAQKKVQQLVPQNFTESADGLYIFNYLIYAVDPGDSFTIRINLLKMLEGRPDKKIEQKIRWAISYFNYHYKYLSYSIDKPQITDEDIEKALKA